MERSKIESSDGDASAVSDVNGSDFFTVPMSQLTKHLLIVGTPGSGKTTAVCNIVNEISRCHVPFLVVESTKREYYNVLKRHLPNVRRLCFDGTLDGTPHRDYFTFDPMRLTHGASVSRHISFLKACFQAAMPLNDVMALILENGMFEYYTRHRSKGGCGLGILQHGGVHTHFVDSRTGHVVPSFEHFRAFFIEHYLEDDLKLHSLAGRGLNTEFVEMTRNAFRRRFELLLSGPIGVSMRRADCQFRIALERLLRSPSKAAAKRLAGAYNPLIPVWWSQAVVELDGLPDNSDKALLMAFLLTFLFEYRQSQFALAASSQSGSVALRHLFVLEEAHRILGRGHISQSRGIDTVGMNSLQTAQMLFENLLAEIRAMGQGIAVVEQIPSKIMPEVVKNTNLRLMLRLSEKEDRDYLGEAMNFTEAQKRFVATLTAGRGVVFEEGLDEPVLIELPRAPRTAQRESAED